jgi:hypothetical protein
MATQNVLLALVGITTQEIADFLGTPKYACVRGSCVKHFAKQASKRNPILQISPVFVIGVVLMPMWMEGPIAIGAIS